MYTAFQFKIFSNKRLYSRYCNERHVRYVWDGSKGYVCIYDCSFF